MAKQDKPNKKAPAKTTPVAAIQNKPPTAAQKRAAKKSEAEAKAKRMLEVAQKPYVLAFITEPRQQSKTLPVTTDTKIFIESLVNSALDSKLNRYFIMNDLRFHILLNQ